LSRVNLKRKFGKGNNILESYYVDRLQGENFGSTFKDQLNIKLENLGFGTAEDVRNI
jgi:hypothetical protein